MRTVFAVGVDEAERAAASVAVSVGVTAAGVQARLTGARVVAVAHVHPGQRFLQQLHRPLVDHHLIQQRLSWQQRHPPNITYLHVNQC